MRRPLLLLSPLLFLFLPASCSNSGDDEKGGDGSEDSEAPDGDEGMGGDGGDPDENPIVGDGNGSVVAKCDYATVPSKEVRDALNAGNGALVLDLDLLFEAALSEFESQRTRFDGPLIEILNLNADGSAKTDGSSLTSITWDPAHDAVMLSGRPGKNASLLVSNDANGGEIRSEAMAILGEEEKGRYLAFAANPLRTQVQSDDPAVINSEMELLLSNSLTWLTGLRAEDSPKVVLAHLEEGYWFPEESSTRTFLDEHYGGKATYNEEDACDGDKLGACLTDADLLIISVNFSEETDNPEAIAGTVQTALRAGTPVLYVHTDGDQTELGAALQDVLSISYVRDNYWDKQRVTDFDGSSLLGSLSADVQAIATTVRHLQDDDFSFEVAGIMADPSASPDYVAEFQAGADAVKNLLRGYDGSGTALFEDCDSLLEKLLVLLGDRLREDIAYPMSASTTATNSFLRAIFADAAQSLLRPSGAAQPDRGNFDPKDLSDVQGEDVTVSLTSRKNFRSAGVYALPGVPVVVTRTDDSAVGTKIFVNSILDRATKPWEEGETAYPRPHYLQSSHLPLAPGDSLTFTHPYGGPIQIEFDENDADVSFEFENVGQHPHWSSAADDESFATRLAGGTFNWVEVVADGFELHSRLDRYEGTIEDVRFDTPAELADAINTYTFSTFHVLAGFEGDFIETQPEINGWAQTAGFNLRVMDVVKHGNMDQPGCGSGCSGNPYDAAWSFSPIGHGDLHELGHGVEKGRFRLTHAGQTYGGHAVTNWWAFYGAARFFAVSGGSGGNWGVTHDHLYAELQAAYVAGDRVGDFSSHMDSYFGTEIAGGDINNSYALYLQAMLMARHYDALTDGYHVVARLQILDEEFQAALADEATWLSARDGLGFGLFSYAQAEAITNNDFIAVGFSFATGLNYADYFAMWGLALSDTAKAQISAAGGTVVERAFFALDSTDHTRGALSNLHESFQKLPVDGASAWPL